MPEPLLELSTLAPERPTVLIKTTEDPEGKLYELSMIHDLGMEQQQFIYSRGRRLGELMEKAKLTKGEVRELDMIVDKLAALVVRDLPREIRGALSAVQKNQLINAFMQASPEMRAAVEAMQRAAAEVPTDGTSTTGR